MNAPFSPNQKDDDIFLDVEIEQEEVFADKQGLEGNFTNSSESSSSDAPFVQKNNGSNFEKKPLSWENIREKRLNSVNKRKDDHKNNPQNLPQEQATNFQFLDFERIKTKTMAIAITLGMLPLLLSSGLVYYFGNQTIKEQQLHNKQQNYELLGEHLEKQKRILIFLLVGTEVTALLVGLISALWNRRLVNAVANFASNNTSLAIKAEKNEQSQILADLVLNMRESINSEDIMTNAVTETRKILQCDRVIIYQFEQQGTGKAVAESFAPQFCEILLTYTEDLGLESKYLAEYQKKQAKVINNIYQDSQLSSEHLSQYESLDIKSCLHAPLEQQGEVSGLLIAYQCSEFRSWQLKEIELFSQIATEIGLALDDAQIVKECLNLQIQLQETSLWQDYLNNSLKCIHSAIKEEEIIKIAVEEVRRVLKSDRAVFCRLDSVNKVTVITESVASEYSEIVGTVIEKAYLETEYHQQNEDSPVQVIHDFETANISSSYQAQLENLGVKSLIFAPVIYRNQLYGFLMAHQCSWQRFWQEFESRWFKQVAQHMGYSLDKSKVKIQEKDSAKDLVKDSRKITTTKPENKAIVPRQLPVFLEESKVTLEKFSQKVLAEVDAVTPVFKQMQVMAKSVEGLTYNINQTKLQSQQVDGILRGEHKNIDLTEDRLIDIQQSIRKIALKNLNLGQSCQEFIQAAEQINNLAESINKQVKKTNREANRIGIVSDKSLQELTQIVNNSTKQLTNQAEAIRLFLGEINGETRQITTTLEKSEAKAFVGIEIVQETRQNLNQITIRNQEINQLIGRIALAATVGEQNSQLAQQSLLEVANLANQAAKKSLIAVSTIASLIKFLEKNQN